MRGVASINIGKMRDFLYTHSDRGVCVENSDIMRLSHCAIHSLRDEQDSAEAKQATSCMLVKEVRI